MLQIAGFTSVIALTEMLRNETEAAIRLVVEGTCPVRGRLGHSRRASLLYICGDTYAVAPHRLEVRQCVDHGRRCEHWEAIWALRQPT